MKKIMQLVLLTAVGGILPLSAGEVSTGNPSQKQMEKEQAEASISLDSQQVKQIEIVIRKFLDQNPHVVAGSLEKYVKYQKDQEMEKVKTTLKNNRDKLIDESTASVIGNPKGSQVIVAFYDNNCGYCRKLEETFATVLKDHKNLKIILRQLPVLGEDSVLAAKAVLAAQNQGKFKDFYQAVVTSEEPIDLGKILEIASKINLNITKFKQDLDSTKIKKILAVNERFAKTLKIRGTPALIVGDQMAAYVDADGLRELLAEESTK